MGIAYTGEMSLKRCVVLAIVVLLCSQAANAIDLYVDPINGNDVNDGASWQTALRTMTRAAELEDGPGCMFLGEGVFSVESGEVFPVTLSQTTEIRGVSSRRTVIAVADPPEVVIWAQGPDQVTISSIGFYSRTAWPRSLNDGACVLSVPSHSLTLANLDFFGFGSQGPSVVIASVDFSADPIIVSRCAFLDCNVTLVSDRNGGDYITGYLSISECLVQWTDDCLSAPGPDFFVPRTGWFRLFDCVFRSASARRTFSLYDSDWLVPVSNCLFDNVAVKLTADSWQQGAAIIGCTFRDSTFSILGYVNSHAGETYLTMIDIVASAFDPQSAIDATDTSIHAKYSCLPIVPTFSGYARYETQFMVPWSVQTFAEGPLGGSYLCNEDSGQSRSSACLNVIRRLGDYSDLWDWPPTGSTTRTDGVPDDGPYYDLGYHYPSVPPPPPAVAVRTDRTEYAVGEEMQAFMTYENRGVKVEGAIYFAFGPESLDWLIFWPWMTFVPTPWVSGTLYSGVSYQNLPPTTHTIPESLAPGGYLWLGAVLASDGTFASDVALWPVTITGD